MVDIFIFLFLMSKKLDIYTKENIRYTKAIGKSSMHSKKSLGGENMKNKKWFALCLTAMLAASLTMAGCGANSDENSQTAAKDDEEKSGWTVVRDENGIPDLQGETISIWMPLAADEVQWVSNYSEYDVFKNLQEQLNVKLEFQHPPVGQEQDSFSIMINSGEWPDILAKGIDYYAGGVEMAIADGIIMPVDEYLGDEYTPNFNKVIMSDESRRRLFVNDDGECTQFGSQLITEDGEFGASCYNGPMIRKDYLEQAGLDAPVTIEDWYEMLTAFKNLGVKVPYGWTAKGGNNTDYASTFSGAYGVNYTFMVTEDGEVRYSPIEPAYKEYLAEMNKWYSEGLINPDFATHTDMDNLYPMLTADEVGAATLHLAGYIQNYYPVAVTDHPEKEMIPVQFPVLNEGDPLPRFRDAYYGTSQPVNITTKAKNPEACVVFIDSMYNPEVFYTMSGTEGVTYNRGNQDFSIDPIWYPNNQDFEMRRKHSTMLFPRIDDNSSVPFYYSNPTQQEGFRLWNQATYDGKLPVGMAYTPEENDAISKYMTDIETYVEEMKMKFMTGAEPLDNFDAFVEQVKAMHIDEVTAAHQQSLDRFNAR